MPKKKNPNNNYFNQDVEDAVCVYLNSDNERERENAFKLIYPALCKISEVWHNKLKVTYHDTDSIDMQMDCVAHIVEKMHMFECGKGTKAFSYFTVMAKFYYMLNNQKNYKYFQKYIPISYMTVTFDRPNSDETDKKADDYKKLLEAFILYMELNLEKILPNPKHRPVGVYLIDLMQNFETLEEINRRKIVNQMASVSGMPTRHIITKVMNDITGQFNLFKRRWESDDNSLNFIEKTTLTAEEIQLVKDNFKRNSINSGVAKLAKKIGINENLLSAYIRNNPI